MSDSLINHVAAKKIKQTKEMLTKRLIQLVYEYYEINRKN